VLDTAWLQTVFKAVDTERTLPSGPFFGIDLYGAKGTGMDAESASVALLFIDKDNSVLSFCDGICVTDRRATGFFAMHTGCKNKISSQLPLYRSRPYGDDGIPSRSGG
jgi:hypothetical protein